MSDENSDIEDRITEDQVRQGFEDIYGVTIEEVIGVLKECLDANHRLLEKMEESGFTEEEKESMQSIQDYVSGRDE